MSHLNESSENMNEVKSIDYEYLDSLTDDETILELNKIIDKNDSIIEKDYLSSLLQQEDRLIYYEVENIYKSESNKVYRNKLSLKNSPPMLIIKDDYENEATFKLTENLVDELTNTLHEVKRAYYGFSEPIKNDIPDKFIDKMVYYAKSNPIKFILPIIIVIITIIIYFK
ncbi:MAG TPA: hypothetical protein GXZ90_10640 [Clostridiales bacterium]|nr:hypothetical protein [Clostridiales bacterium]